MNGLVPTTPVCPLHFHYNQSESFWQRAFVYNFVIAAYLTCNQDLFSYSKPIIVQFNT